MVRSRVLFSVSLGLAGVLALAGHWQPTSGQEKKAAKPSEKPAAAAAKPAAAAQQAPEKEPGEVDEIRKMGAAFVKAFNAGDAKAVAAFWTEAGEYIGPDGVVVSGREAIEKDHAEFFKANPKAKLSLEIGSIRVLGKSLAQEEGSVKVEGVGKGEETSSGPNIGLYSVFHVREGDAWKMASVREWVPTADQLASPKDLEWLIGDWTAKSGDTEVQTSYAWDDVGAFIVEKYTLSRSGEKVASGKQMIGRNPEGGLRAWQFHDRGGFGESFWSKDGNHWMIDVTTTGIDGAQMQAVNILVPIDKNTFTWQSIDRFVGDTQLPDLPPVKVTRVGTAKPSEKK